MAIILLFLLLGWPQQQEENPRARAASIYPHPKPPEHLVSYNLDLQIVVEKKHWLWTTREPYLGTVQLQQMRTRGGWYPVVSRTTDADGHIVGKFDLDPTWNNPPHVLLLLFDGRTQTGAIEFDVTSKNFKKELAVSN